ncbi:uncharacterized protein B0P05DRAFT_575786 [Gilbertella persicaria]|uniref:uncharacterized protein n=1 Tax=Gilbertella persicaria TaxID=101096 RepID=UPI00221F5AC0|nr:uncharacterized protein B0P05DRAFT_575786 [Gilbertella persicaria]KAI8050130.1 hypothetical protein B0P05DRAFT_575786 [Gilbertella persicaria]
MFYQSFERLSFLTLDLPKSILPLDIIRYTPHLKSLTLMRIHQWITFELMESIHQNCPYLESLSLEGDNAQALSTHSLIQPAYRLKSFELNVEFGADRYHDWLIYLGQKYPRLISCRFRHSGRNKDMIEPCPTELYAWFIACCPFLVDLQWHNIIPDFRFFRQLHQRQLKRLVVYDNSMMLPTFLTSALFDHPCLSSLTHLTLAMPRSASPNEFIQSIARTCPRLKHLGLRETYCDLSAPFKMDNILDHCQHLVSLELHRIALRVLATQKPRPHPLERLEMNQCCLFDGVFDHIALRCFDLKYLQLFALTQKDRRYKVRIHLPFQKLHKAEIAGLRTETFDIERRIRFFSIQHHWFYMSQFDVPNDKIEVAQAFEQVDISKSQFLSSLWTTSQRKNCIQDWDTYDAGHVDFQCQSIQYLYLNKKRVL